MKLLKSSHKIIEIGLISLTLLVPLYFDTHLYSVYDLSKLVIFSLLSLIMLYIWVLRIVTQNQIEFSYHPLLLPLMAFFLISLISTILSPCLSLIGLYRRYNGLITTINYLVVFLLVFNFVSRVDKLVKGIICAGTVAAIYGILQHFGLDPFFVSLGFGRSRVTSTFGNPVFLSAYLIMVFPLALSLYLEKEKGSNKGKTKVLRSRVFTIRYGFSVFYGLSLSLIYTCLLMAKTRAAFLGLLGALLLFGVLDFRRIWQNKRVVILALVLTALTFIFGLGKDSMMERVITSTKAISSSEERFKLWAGAIAIIKDHPLLGIGQENMSLIFPKYAPEELVVSYKGARISADRSHNELLDVAVEKGIIGLSIYLWLLISFIIIASRVIKDKPSKSMGIGILSAWTGYLIQAQFNLNLISITHLFFILMGMMVVLDKSKIKNQKLKVNRLTRIILGCSTILWLFLLIFIIRIYLADVNFQQAMKLEKGGFRRESIPHYLQAIRLNPREKEYRFALIQTYLDLGKDDEALTSAYETTSLASKDSYSWYLLARALENNGKSPLEIINAYQKAKELNPCWADVHNNLGILYAKLKEWTQAKESFELAIKFNPTSIIFLDNLVNVCLEIEDTERAKKILERIIELSPQEKLINVHNRLAWIYYQQGNFKKASFHYQAMIELSPFNIEAHRNLGSVYYKLGKNREAQQEFKEVLRLDPNNNYAIQMLKALK